MAKLWRTLLARYRLDEYLADLSSGRSDMVIDYGSGAYARTENVENSFTGYIQNLYKQNGVVYAVMAARRLLFKQARIMWQEFVDGEEGKLFWTPELEAIRRPWPNGTTGELLSRMDQDVSLGGNFYAVREGNRVRRLRPDWVTIVLSAPPAEAVQSDVAGYWFHPGRSYANVDGPTGSDEVYLPDEVCHWTPDPDPDAQYRGMSWLTPIVKEVMADKAATDHKGRFFTNGATLGAIISAKENLTPTQFQEWMANFNGQHQGVDNAYRPLFFASPVDVAIRGLDLKQLDFKVTQGHGETRVCAAGRVPPIIVGVSEGLEAATYSNYGQARRAFGDGWAHPQWEDAVGALETIVAPPESPARLWYSHKHIAFLREDLKDQAGITHTQMLAVEAGVRAGYKPDTVQVAVATNDLSVMEHTGLYSVQLQPAGARSGPEEAEPATDAERADRNQLKKYWLHGEGLAKWATSPHPWTTLRNHLVKYVGAGRADRIASEWFHEHFGYWPGHRKGDNPVGPG